MKHGRRSFLAALTSLALVVGTVFAGVAAPAFAADGDVQVTKEASVTQVSPGQSFSYTIAVSCTSITTGCNDAVLTDSVPAELIINNANVGVGLSGLVTIDGQDVTVDFTMPTASGGTGLPGGTTGVVTINVTVRSDLPYELNGTTLRNTATTNASTQTSGPLSDSADVTLVIPLALDVDTTKTMTPPSAVATPGLPVTATVSATNRSNANVDTVTLTDPADPEAAGNPFDTLPYTGIGTVSYPAGAETAQVLLWDGTDWVAGPVATAPAQPVPPGSVADADVRGVQIVFADTDDSGIAPGSTGSAEILMEQPDDVHELPNTTVTNTVDGTVDLDGQQASEEASATHQIVAEDIDVIARKQFSPDAVAAGDTTTATITAGNESEFALTGLTITEPALVDPDDPYADGFDESMQFAGFADGIDWPADATGATITYYYADGTSEGPTAFADGATPPAASGEVVRFEISFTGPIQPGAQTEIPFTVQTDPDQVGYPAVLTNVATVTGDGPAGGSASEDAQDDLLVYEKHLETITDKSIYPASILDRPGEWALVTITGRLAPFPGSTTDADEIVVQEPVDVPYEVDGSFWDSFDATEITNTAVPPNTTMTINYWNGSEWVPLLDENGDPVSVHGDAVFSMQIPEDEQDDILGLQFVFTADDGSSFPPGTTVEPHFSVEKRTTERDTTTVTTPPADIENCGTTSASAPALQSTPTDASSDCSSIHVDPYDPDGDGPDVLDKDLTPQTIVSRSQSQATGHLHWSTGGLSGVEQVVIQDESTLPANVPAALAESFFDAFDLVRIPQITAEMDPHLVYDEITAVEIWTGTGWQAIENDPCPAACVGGFPGVTLTDGDRAAALGVRLLVQESADRAAASVGDPTAPPVGSGVARSSGNDREVQLVFELRDTRRSDGAPAMGDLDYNIDDGDPAIGTVENTGSVTGTDASGQTVIDTDDSDTIAILDVPLNVDLTKTWSNSPFGLPPIGTDQSQYPTGRVVLDALNLTATKVDRMSIVDPMPGAAQTPFGLFDLLDILSVSVPAGADADATEIVLSHDADGDAAPDPGGDTTHTIAEALALGIADLDDVVGIQVLFEGRIDPNAHGILRMDLRLRTNERGTGAPLDPDAPPPPLTNYAEASVGDAGGGTDGNTPTADDSATVEFDSLNLAVEAGKSFSPDVQTEPDDSPVTMTLTGQPTGSARTGAMRIVDGPGTFWNAYDYVGIDPSFTFTAPINRVRMDVFTGATFTAVGGSLLTTGGSWVNGPIVDLATFLADPLPVGILPEDVQGVRLSFVQEDAEGNWLQWENPTDPLQEVPVTVQRRAELRSGGEVPTDRTDLSPAPGETAAGVFTNDIRVWGCANLDTLCASEDPTNPNLVFDDTSAQIRYQHLPSEVTIVKTPTFGSEFGPGQVIPYTITVTNTGEYPIENPVIVDAPQAGDQLLLNPDAGEAGPFRYTLTGAPPSPPTGDPLPVDPEEVTVDYDDASGPFTFTFPEGSRLEVGQSYTIAIDLVIAPGVPATTLVDNTASISGDRPFDTCNGDGPPVDECSASTEIVVLGAGAARSGKLVRTLDTELGVFNANDPEAVCAPVASPLVDPDGEGFYFYPCVPVSKPGGIVEWRLVAANTGNIPMDRLVMTDRIPTPGDTGVISELGRGSQWTPVLVGESIQLVNHPEATWTYEVALGDVCADDLGTTMSPQCPDDAWVPYVDGMDTTQITAIQITIDFPDGDPLLPGDVVLVDARTETPAVSETAGRDTIAWNTVASGAHLTEQQSNGSTDMPPVEGTKVGAALATGSLELLKTTSGDGEQFAPDTLEVTLECVSAKDTPVEETLTYGPYELVPDVPYLVENLPWGAECEIVEGDNGQIDANGTGGVVVDPTDPDGPPVQQATLDNVYALAGLEITKTVDSDAVAAGGEPIEYGPFEVTVDCTFLGEPVWAEGYDESPMVFPIEADETVELTGLPANAECIVSETDADGATVTLSGSNADGPIAADDGSITVVLTPDDDAEITNAVEIVNAFGVGSILIEKIIEPEDSPFAEGPYIVHVTCTLDGDSTWNGDVTMAAASDDPATPDDETDLSVQIDDIAAGSQCSFAETDDGFASSTVIDPETTIVGADQTVTVTVTNTYDEGSVTVTKTFAGDTRWADTSYEITIACIDLSSGSLFVTIPGGPTRLLTEQDGWTASYDRLPAGAFCIMGETDPGGAASSQILDENGDPVGFWRVGPDDARSFTAVNTFEVSSLEVVKTTSGEGAELWGTDTFTVHLECTAVIDGAATSIEIPGGADRTLQVTDDPATATATYEALPPGAECALTEPDAGGASGVTITPNDGEDLTTGIVTVRDPDAEPVQVAIDNAFDIGGIEVTKSVSGDGQQWATGEFEVSLACTWNGGEIVIPGGATRTLSVATSLTATYDDLPDGAECQLTETDEANASIVTMDPEDGIVTVEPGTTVEIEVDNRFDVGAIQVRKLVRGDGADIGGDTTFWVSLSCDWELQGETIDLPIPGTPLRPLNAANEYTATYQGLPNGAECTVTETYDGGAGSVTIAPDDGTVVVAENSTVDVVVVNTFDSGDLVIEKALAGGGAEFFGQGPFTVHVRCTLDDGGPLPRIVYDDDVVLGGDEPLTATISGIPTGSECTLEETDDGGADESTVEPGSVVIDDSESDPVEVVVTNTFLIGSIVVHKVVTGDGAAQYGAGPFEVTIECVDPTAGLGLVDIPGGATRALNAGNGYTARYDVLPAGALCGIAETGDGDADATRLLDADGDEVPLIELGSGTTAGFFRITSDVELSFTLENTFHAPLPPTGADGVRWAGLAALGLLVVAAGMLAVSIGRRRRV